MDVTWKGSFTFAKAWMLLQTTYKLQIKSSLGYFWPFECVEDLHLFHFIHFLTAYQLL